MALLCWRGSTGARRGHSEIAIGGGTTKAHLSPRPYKAAAPKGPAFRFLNYRACGVNGRSTSQQQQQQRHTTAAYASDDGVFGTLWKEKREQETTEKRRLEYFGYFELEN